MICKSVTENLRAGFQNTIGILSALPQPVTNQLANAIQNNYGVNVFEYLEKQKEPIQISQVPTLVKQNIMILNKVTPEVVYQCSNEPFIVYQHSLDQIYNTVKIVTNTVIDLYPRLIPSPLINNQVKPLSEVTQHVNLVGNTVG